MKCSKKIYGIILLFLMFVMIFAVGCGTVDTEESEESLESESSEIPDNDSYDTATTDSYTVNWENGTGYFVTVTRTSSPYGDASTGALSSGAVVYYGDVLSVTYTASTGYTIGSCGSTSITVSGDITSSDIYATVIVNSYIASWSDGTGYTIAVSRTSSPFGNASTGALSSGATVYYGDVLSVTYTASTGYIIGSCGSTSITVTGNVTSSNIYATATATANTYTYNIVYVSSNGTSLGTATATYDYGTTNTITPESFSGYTTPSAQSVTWDSTTAKTITFIYTPSSVTNSAYAGTRSTSPNVTYTAEFEYQNRTATSVQVRVTWTLTIDSGYDSYAQLVQLTAGKNTSSAATVVSFDTWKDSVSYSRTASATTDWVTVPLSTTNQTTVSASVYSYKTNAFDTEIGSGATYTFTVNIPAY